MRALAPATAAAVGVQRCRSRHAPAAPRAPRAPRASRCRASPAAPGARDDGSEMLADVCASLGVRFELTDDDEAAMWEDDYLEVVAEADDAWGREAAAVDGAPLVPPPWLATPAGADAAQTPADAPGALSSAYSPAQGFREVSAAELAAMVASAAPPLVIDVRSSGGEGGIVAGDALASATSSPDTLRIPLAELSAAVRAGRLDSGRSRAVVCVCDTGAAAAQAAVRLRRVFGFADVAALRGGSAPP